MAPDEVGRQKFCVARQRTQSNHPAGVGLAAQFLQISDVHQQFRSRKPHIKPGEKALSAGNRHGFAGCIHQYPACIAERRRSDVTEIPRFHG